MGELTDSVTAFVSTSGNEPGTTTSVSFEESVGNGVWTSCPQSVGPLGDTDAFGELVRRHRDRLWSVALRTTAAPEAASAAPPPTPSSGSRSTAR